MADAKPRRGTPAQRAHVLAHVRSYMAAGGHPSRDAFLVHERTVPAGVSNTDLRDCGGWGSLVEAARAVSRPPAVDISGLDYDEDPDTVPGGLPAVPPPPRAPEPRELLDLRKARTRIGELERRLADTLEALDHAGERALVERELSGAPEPPPILRRETTSGMREATPVVLASDWHAEEVVDPRTIEGRNAYSPEIARRRAERMTDGILWLIAMHRDRFVIRDMVLWLGGDLISGYIHEELEETNAVSPIEAVLFVHELVAGMVRTLLDRAQLERIVVPCNVGNHGRTTRRTRAKTRVQNSYEYLLYRHLEQQFADDPRVEFHIAGGSHLYLDVYDQTIRFMHGDDVRYWGGVGGLTIPLNKSLAAWQTFRHADLTCLGHFHQLLHGRDFVVNGSLVGYSEYALAIKAQWEPPRQAFFLMDSVRGRCCATPLWVDDVEESWREAG